jgi:hypothetical protein
MRIKAETLAVEPTTLACDLGEDPRPAFCTVDSLDSTKLHVVQHIDEDVSIYIDFEGEEHAQVVMTREQAKEFFTLALTLC